MESTQVPTGLEQWIELLRDKLLPVPAPTIALLRRQLNDPLVSLQQLNPIISRDPVLAMHCVSLANRLNRNPDTDVSTIELAVSTLGLDRITELATTLPAIKLNLASVPHKQYFHALADSYHAATQALILCRYKDPTIINSTRTAALFYGIGYWALWRYAPTQMSQIKVRIHEQQQDSAFAETEVLGCTVQQISEQLIEHWRLSRLAVEALQHQTSPDAEMLQQIHQQATDSEQLDEEQQRSAKLLLNSPFYPVKLANWLALTAPVGWHHPKTLRIEQLISDLMLKPLDEVISALHQTCVKASREHPIPGLMSPAAMMLLLPSALILNYRFGDAGKADTKPAVKEAATPKAVASSKSSTTASNTVIDKYRDHALFQSILQQLTEPPPSVNNRNQILDLLLKGAVDGLGMERMLSYQVNSARRMTPIGNRGCRSNEPLTNLTLNLETPSLFKQMTHKAMTLWINDDNRDKALAALPERFKSICHPHSFILCSLFGVEPQPLILYADLQHSDRRIDAFQLQQFKRLTKAADNCLKQVGKTDR